MVTKIVARALLGLAIFAAAFIIGGAHIRAEQSA
jgi:hypothetical protein